MIARPLPLILFSPLAVAWMILHWRAVRRVEVERAAASLYAMVAAAKRAHAALVEMTVAMIQTAQAITSRARHFEEIRLALDLSPLALYRPVSETLSDAGIPSSLDPDREIADVTTDRL